MRPEITGKASQFGTLEEVLDLSAELEGVAPCLSFAHLRGRTGRDNTYDEFVNTLRQVEERLGRSALDNVHVLVSGISFHKGEHAVIDKKEEMRHVNLRDSDFNYGALLQALKDFDAKGIVLCESPNLEEDALLLKATYCCICAGYQCSDLAPDAEPVQSAYVSLLETGDCPKVRVEASVEQEEEEAIPLEITSYDPPQVAEPVAVNIKEPISVNIDELYRSWGHMELADLSELPTSADWLYRSQQ